jgi:tetratricopeptide (TPR) repeat protein
MRRGGLDRNTIGGLGAAIERALFWGPTRPHSWMLWAKWFAIQGREEPREWTLREMARLFPDNEPARVELARLLIRRGKAHWDEAELWLREAAERNRDREHSHVELARLLIRRGETHWDEAELWLREAAKRNPTRQHSRVELARLLVRRGGARWDEAERWLREVVEGDARNKHSRVELARLLIRRGPARWEEAWDLLDKLLVNYPDNGPAHVMLAALLDRGQRRPEAIGLLNNLLERDPTNSGAREMRDRLVRGMEIDMSAIDPDLDAIGWDDDTTEAAADAQAAVDASEPERGGAEPLAAPELAEAPRASKDADMRSAEFATPKSAEPEVEPGGAGPPASMDRPETADVQKPEARMTLEEEIERRGRLSAEFRVARTAVERGEVPTADLVRRQAWDEDALAGFYLQWLIPSDAPEPPPNAWAWKACRLWQDRASADEWRGLERRSAEFAAETSFLGWLAQATADRRERERWLARFSDEGAASWPPRLHLMRGRVETLEETDASQRNEVALAILSSAALAPPEFAA